MKLRRLSVARLSFPLATAIAALLASQFANAAGPYYWDNVSGVGFGAASGTWSTTTAGPIPGWNTDVTGTAAPASVTTATTDAINFGNGATGLAAGTITVSGAVSTGNLTFASGSGGIILSGGTSITMAAAESIQVDNTADTISSVLAGAATSLTKAGTGKLTLGNANTYTGATTVSDGTLSVGNVVVASSASGLGNATSAVVLGGASTKGTLLYTGAIATYTRNFTVSAGGGEVDSTAAALTLLPGTTPTYAPIALTSGPLTLGTGTTAATTYITIGSTTMTGPMFTGTNALNINGNSGGVGIVKLNNLATGGASVVTAAAMPINIKAGTLQYAFSGTATLTANLLGTGTITLTPAASNGGALSLSVGSITDTLGNPFAIADAAGTSTIAISGGITIGQAIAGPSGSNTPTLLLQNANGSAFTFTVSGGVTGKLNLQLQGTNNSANNPITLSTGTVNNAGTISNISTTGSSAMTVSAPIGSNVTGFNQAGITPFNISGAIASANSNLTFLSTNTGAMTVSSVITSATPITASATSTGNITFSGASTGFTGGLKILAGTVNATTSVNALGANTNIVTLGDTTGSANATLNIGTTALNFAQPIVVAAGSSGIKKISGGASANSPQGAITLNDSLTISPGAANMTYTSTAIISGVAGKDLTINATGVGLYIPQQQNTYPGTTHLLTTAVANVDSTGSASTANLTSGPFGTGILSFEGGSMRPTSGATGNIIGNAVLIAANITFANTALTTSLTFNGPVTLTGTGTNRALTYALAGGNIVFSGNIGDGGNANAITIGSTNTATFTFSGTNSYTGGTTVNGGTLRVSGSLANNSGLSVTPGTAAGTNISFINNAANTPANFSSLSLGSVTGTSFVGLDLGTSSDTIATSSVASATNNIAFNLNAAAGFVAGNYNLITAASGLTSSAPTYSINSAPGGFTYGFTNTDSQVQLNVTAAAAGNRYWRGNLDNSWATFSGTSTTNWATNSAGTVGSAATPGSGDTVIFSAANATGPAITTTLDNIFTFDNLQFASAPTGVSSVMLNPGVNSSSGAVGTMTINPASFSSGITLAQGAGAVTIAAPIALGASQTWSVDSSTPSSGTASSLIVSGAVTGTTPLTINGPITLSAAASTSTYSGATTVPNGAILQGGATNSFSANSAMTVSGTGILRLNGSSNTIAALTGDGTVQNNHASTAATLTVGDATNFTFSGTLQNGGVGTFGLTKTGAGKLTLSGTNTHTGTTTVSAGTLVFGSATALNSANPVTLSGTGTLDLNGFNQTIGTFVNAATNFITNNAAGTGTNTLTISPAAPTLSALITDGPTAKTGVRVNNANSGALLLTNTANTFSGGLILADNAGGTRMLINTALSGTPFGTGSVFIGETATDRAGIYFAAVNNTVSNPIVNNTGLGNDRYGIRNDGRTITLSGVITANADVVFSSNMSTASNTIITNKVTGAGGLAIDLSQTSTANTVNTVTLATAANTNNYAGDTIVGRANATPTQNYTATLALGAADQIPNGAGKGNVILNNNTGSRIAIFSLAGFSETINGLSGNGNVDGTSGTPTLTLGDNNATGLNFSGVIKNTAGTLTVTKIGTGTQTLSGASTFTGPLNINAGLVAFSTSPATGGPLGNTPVVNLSGGGLSYTASGSNTLNRPIAIGASNGTVNVASSTGTLTVSAVTSSSGNLIKTGSGTAIISGSTTLNTGLASVAVNDGTLRAGFGTAGVATITVGATGNLDQTNAATQALVLGNSTGALTLSGGAKLGFEFDNLSTPANDSIAVAAGGTAVTSGTVTLDLFSPNNSMAAGTYTLLTAPGGLSGATYVLGAAPSGFNYTINASNTTVSVTVTNYTPIFWNNTQADGSWNNTTGTLGSIGAGSGTNWTNTTGVTDSGHLPLPAETVIFSAASAPTGAVTTNLNTAFTIDSLQFTNMPGSTNVTIAAGTSGSLTLTPVSTSGGIRVLNGGGTTTISAPLSAGAAQTWDVDPSGSLTISGNTTFTRAVNKTNTGVLTLSGINSGSGAVTLTGGTLNLNSATALGSGVFSVGAGTTIDAFSGATALTLNNAQTWNGDFTFTGTNNLDLGTGNVALANSLTVTTSGSNLTVGGVISGSSRSLTKTGAGTLTLRGANTYTGGTTLNTGTLTLSGNNTFGVGGVTVNGGIATLSGANSFSGGTTLNTGTLNLGNAGALGSGTLVIAGGILDNSNGSAMTLSTNNALTWSGNFTFTGTNDLNLGTGAVALSGARTATVSASTLTLGGTISGVVASLVKAGAGALALTGTNTYTGGTTISAGTLIMGNTQALGTVAGAVTLAGGTLDIATAGSDTAYNPITGSGSSGTIISDVASGTVGINHTLGTYLIGGSASPGGTQLNIIKGATVSSGTPTITLGAMNLSSGTASVTTTLNPTTAGLLIGTVTSSNTASHVLNLDGTNTGNQVTGVISDGTGLSITKTNTGTWTLSGVNTFTGSTTVSGGTLNLAGSSSGTLGAITVAGAATPTMNIQAGNYTQGAGGFFVGTGVGPGIVNQTGGTLTWNSASLELLIGNGGAGTYNLSGGSITTFTATSRGVMLGVNPGGTATFNLSGTGTLTTIGSPLMIGRSDASAGSTTNLFSQTAGTATIATLTMGGPVSATTAENVSATLSLSGGTFSATAFTLLSAAAGDTSIINIGGTANVTLPAFPTVRGTGSTATITFDSTTGFLSPAAATATYLPAGTFTNAYLTANGAKFNVPNTKDITITQVLQDAVSPAAAGTLTKSGVGTLTLSAANTYTGLTSVNVGSIDLGNISALGTAAAGTTVGSGARVTFGTLTTASTVAEPFNIAGTGTATNGVLNVGGNKTITLSGAITLSANATVSTDVGAAFNFTSASGISGTNTSLTFQTDGSVASSITGPIALGSGGLTKTSTSTLILSGANTYTGNTVVNAGTLTLADNAQLKFVLGATSGTNNSITGAGTVNLDGDFVIDTSAADSLPSGTWTLENVTSLTGAYGSTFTVVGFVDAGGDKWTKTLGSKKYTFDETTGVLTLAPSAGYTTWAAINAPGSAPGLDYDGDGVSNAVEYILGGDKNTNDLSKLPTVDASGSNLVFSFKRAQSSIDGTTTVAIQVGTTLAAWPDSYSVPETAQANNPGVTVQKDTPALGTDTVTLRVVKAPDVTKFARLVVTPAP